MKTLRNLTALGLIGALALTATSCGNTVNPGHEEETTQSFSITAINATVGDFTRAHNATWDQGDEIGIFVVADGEIIDQVAAYVLTGDNSFSPKDQPLSGEYKETLEVYAFYPYEAASLDSDPMMKTGTIGMYLAYQNDRLGTENGGNSCDLMVAEKVSYTNTGAPQEVVPSFKFRHVLSNVVIDVEEDPSVANKGFLPESVEIKLYSNHIGDDRPTGGEGHSGFFPGEVKYDVVGEQYFVTQRGDWEPRMIMTSGPNEEGLNDIAAASFMLVPFEAGLLEFYVIFPDGTEQRVGDRDFPGSLEPGKKYRYTVYVKPSDQTSQVDVTGVEAEIEDWVTQVDN